MFINGIQIIGIDGIKKLARTTRSNNNWIQVNYNIKTKKIWGTEVTQNSRVLYQDVDIRLLGFIKPDEDVDYKLDILTSEYRKELELIKKYIENK